LQFLYEPADDPLCGGEDLLDDIAAARVDLLELLGRAADGPLGHDLDVDEVVLHGQRALCNRKGEVVPAPLAVVELERFQGEVALKALEQLLHLQRQSAERLTMRLEAARQLVPRRKQALQLALSVAFLVLGIVFYMAADQVSDVSQLWREHDALDRTEQLILRRGLAVGRERTCQGRCDLHQLLEVQDRCDRSLRSGALRLL